MKWSDIYRIADMLIEKHPNVDPLTINFVTLHNWVINLPGFNDDHSRGGEKVLEAIQQAWISEM